MQCDIDWQRKTRDEWHKLLCRCPHSTILQAYYYAQAMREVKQQGARHGLIMIDGVQAGIVQMQDVGLFKNIIHFISIDRGPLWFDGYGTADHLAAFADALNRQFPARFGRKRRIMFEFFDENRYATFTSLNKNEEISVYKTFMVDLMPNLNDIRENFNKRWQRSLLKAEKSNISAEIDVDLTTLSVFLEFYMKDRVEKGYPGASPKFLTALTKYAAMNDDCFILNAQYGGEIIAAILIFTHGQCATYQTGWTSRIGREKNAHHFLFWQAIHILKNRQIDYFDLGGHNDGTGGIYKFKRGLGGREIALIGSYG